jgi:hypothetical protein
MMALDNNATTSSTTTTTTTSSKNSKNSTPTKMVSKNNLNAAALRRRRSNNKGGLVSNKEGHSSSSGDNDNDNNDKADNNKTASLSSQSSPGPEHSDSTDTTTTTAAAELLNSNSSDINTGGNSTEIDPSKDDDDDDDDDNNNNIIPNTTTTTQTQTNNNMNDPASSSGKPCHAARLSLLCCQNALRMGARTQLRLCPPGRARRELKAVLRQMHTMKNDTTTNTTTVDVNVTITSTTTTSTSASHQRSSSGSLAGQQQQQIAGTTTTIMTPSDTGGYFGVDKMIGSDLLENIYPAQEEEILMSTTNTFDSTESDEEASSGDDDELINTQELMIDFYDNNNTNNNNVNINHNNNNNNMNSPSQQRQRREDFERKYENLTEPLFTPNGEESSLSNSINGPMSMSGGGGGGGISKLPFNRRKIRYFDSIAAQDTTVARSYLQKEMLRSKQREVMLLAQHLKRSQRIQRRKLKEKRGEPLSANELNNVYDDDDDDEDDLDSNNELALTCVSKFDQPMTPGLAAALVIESLGMNQLESIEGMAKCYVGITDAGKALLEINSNSSNNNTDTSSSLSGNGGKRTQIMAALTPLLISSLEQPSGDVIIALAKVRRMCGTPRYQRRFVQRVAPALIRPANGAMWCLQHQSDMKPILAAAELIFDSAMEIFSKGWYDRGQLLLADTKRAETLNTVAMQLRNLSSHNPEDHHLMTLELGGHNTWRSNNYRGGGNRDSHSRGGSAKEPLAEWEVIAVDRQIRASISNIISMDWSRVVVSKEAALSSASFNRSRQSSGRSRPSVLLQATSSGDMNMSPNNTISTSPMSPLRQPNLMQYQHRETGDMLISNSSSSNYSSHFTPTSSDMSSRERTGSPIPTGGNPPIPLSPPPPNRSGTDTQTSSNLFPSSEHAPPRSPTPKHKEYALDVATSSVAAAASSSVPTSPMSPKRNKNIPNNTFNTTNTNASIAASVSDNVSSSSSPIHPHFGGDNRAPLSPPSVGAGTSASEGIPHNRPISSASSVSSSITGISGITGGGSQPSHYRMLTSTAAERRRTVAACRALRAQITRFEDAFVQLHGRPPKGAVERSPLATTYAQYREWKRAIRADAACRIQALFRGASTRWMLLRSNNPEISKVVRTRAGRRGFALQNDLAPSPGGQNSLLEELSIPAEIGDNIQESVFSPNANVQGSNQTLVPQWGDQIHRRRTGSNDFNSAAPIPRPASPVVSASPRNSGGSLNSLSLPELQALKRDLKQQLKKYDMSFARRHGRMPVKAEKEPIRHLYERYNALKTHIGDMEIDGRRSSSPPSNAVPTNSSSAMLTQQRPTVSPVGSDSEDSTGRRSNNTARRPSPSSPSSASSPPAGAPVPSGDLATLKTEKGRLHQMLRSFERDFFRENQRQVQSFADIRPVASQYRRYKEIKRAIAALQRGERS